MFAETEGIDNQHKVVDPSVPEPINKKIKPLTFEQAIEGWLMERHWADLYSPLPKSFSCAQAQTSYEDRHNAKQGWLLVEKAISAATKDTRRSVALVALVEHHYGHGKSPESFVLFKPGGSMPQEVLGLGLDEETLSLVALRRFVKALKLVVGEQ